jgi:hypothetical protein
VLDVHSHIPEERMRRSIVVLTAVLVPISASAQQPAPPRFTSVGLFEVPVAESPRFEEGVRAIVDAAGKARLQARWGWEMWQTDNTYAVISGLQSLGELDDPMAWMKQFNNTPGQAALLQAFATFNGMPWKEEMEVMEAVAEWTYVPAAGPPRLALWAEVGEYWLTAGSDEQYNALVKDAMALLKSIDYPFMVVGHRTPLGKRRTQFVILHSDPARYAAEEAKLYNNPQWLALVGRFTAHMAEMKHRTWRYRTELSYRATP